MNCESILIVEDNTDIRETLEAILKNEGYRVYALPNGREALRIVRNLFEPCMILLDLMMPNMNGWEFVENQLARETNLQSPIIVMSALGASTVWTNPAMQTAVKGYIKKPLDLGELLQLVQQYCVKPALPILDLPASAQSVPA